MHYAPLTRAFRYTPPLAAPPRSGVLAIAETPDAPAVSVIQMPASPTEYAQRFYAALRVLDAMKLDAIHIELPPDEPEWAAVRDRIMRATQPRDG